MQFMVIGELRPDLLDEGKPSDLDSLLELEQVYGARYLAEGIVKQAWSIAGVLGAVAIFEAPSRQEFDRMFAELPLVQAGYVQARIIELEEYQGIPSVVD